MSLTKSSSDDLKLLIKSRYPLVFTETVDELYTLRQLQVIAAELGLHLFEWSLSQGLRKAGSDTPYYQTKEPAQMLATVLSLTKLDSSEVQPALFVLKDLEQFLNEPTILRLLKDSLNNLKGSDSTIAIVSANYFLPKDLQTESCHFISGYPSETEIEQLIRETIRDTKRTNFETRIEMCSDELQKVVKALRGLAVQQIRNVINQCVVDDNILNLADLSTIESYKQKAFDREGLLEFYPTQGSDKIAGFMNLKRWLLERRACFKAETSSSLPLPKGVLLLGVQGCGKSLAIRVIAQELDLPLYRLDLTRLYSKYIGETEQNLRKALATAEKLSPLCLWIDEIEKGFSGSGSDGDGGVSQRVLGAFLTWMQERTATSFIAATANDVYRLPPEFLRKGRFDEIFFVDLPDLLARQELFRIQAIQRNLDPKAFDLNLLAEVARGFSGAEIEQAVISALYRASNENVAISTEHIIEQIQSTKPLSVLKKEEIDSLRSWARERTISA